MRIAAALLSSMILSAMLAGCGGSKPSQSPDNSAAATAGQVAAFSSELATGPAASPSTADTAASPTVSDSISSPGAPASSSPSPSASPAMGTAAPKSTADLQGESRQALDDLQQALKELDDMNKDTGAQSDINGLN